jgi:SET domain-containing protein
MTPSRFYILSERCRIVEVGKNRVAGGRNRVFIRPVSPTSLKILKKKKKKKKRCSGSLIIVEEITDGFQTQTELLTGNYHESAPVMRHWCHVTRYSNPWCQIRQSFDIHVVSIEPSILAASSAHVEELRKSESFKGTVYFGR